MWSGSHSDRIDLTNESAFRVGPLSVIPQSHEILLEGALVDSLEPRIMQVLVALNRANGEVVSREQLIDSCWNGRTVSVSAIQRCIGRLRKLGQAHDAFAVQLITKTGYRLRAKSSSIPTRTDHDIGDGLYPAPVRDRPSLGVLPFRAIAENDSLTQLAAGMHETLIAALSRIGACFVISRNSTMKLIAGEEDIVRMGRKFGVSYVVEGSIQGFGSRLRVTLELCETRHGNVIWAGTCEGDSRSYFELQDKTVELLAGQFVPSIQKSEIDRITRKRPEDLSAYDLTMRALAHVWLLEKVECERALQLLDEALKRSPGYPLAHAYMAWCLAQMSVYNWTENPEKSNMQALQHAERAANQSQDEPLILAVLGSVHSILRNLGTARILLERAVSIDPNNAFAFQRLGWLEVYSNNPETSIDHFEAALRLSPYDPMNFNVHVGLGSACEEAGRFEEAINHYEKALAERPQSYWIYRHLATAQYGAGDIPRARMTAEKVKAHYPDLSTDALQNTLAYPPRMIDHVCSSLQSLGLRSHTPPANRASRIS